MQLIRGIALLLAGLIILALIAAAFLPKTMQIERNIVINKPADEVYDQVADMKNWLSWSPWAKMDPEAQHQISTPSRGTGAHWDWEGDEIGKGRLVQEDAEEDKMVRFSLSFEKPVHSEGIDLWQFEGLDDGSTQVTWTNEMSLDYPVGRLSAYFVQPRLEKEFDKGLQNLKSLLEKEPEPVPTPVPVIDDSATVTGA